MKQARDPSPVCRSDRVLAHVSDGRHPILRLNNEHFREQLDLDVTVREPLDAQALRGRHSRACSEP